MVKNSRLFPLAALLTMLILASTSTPKIAQAAQIVIQLGWVNPMLVHDVAVSDDGNYLAAVNNTGLYYFSADSSTPLWSYQPPTVVFRSVAISAEGDYVIAGDNDGFLHYFNQSRTRTSNQTLPTWTSVDLGGPIEKGTLDMSANGNYTVVGGTGTSIWYFANCQERTGADNTQTWNSVVGWEFYTVHISASGRYVAGGGTRGASAGFVVFYENATTLSGYNSPKWYAFSQLTTPIIDLALSDDGYAVAAIDTTIATLHYWADATTLTGDPNATWTNSGSFGCIDMSANGDNVVTGGIYLTSVHFWGNARARTGMQSEDWIRLETVNVYDVAISKDGTLIAAPTMNQTVSYLAYFLTSGGNTLNEFVLPQFSNMVSMSGLGNTIAMAGPGYDSLYVFRATLDSKPPDINQVTQDPDKNNVYPNNTVKILANVTDEESGVKQVILNYTTGNGTWFTQTMDPYSRDTFNGTIPIFPYCTTVTYVIIAEDNANNTITSVQLELVLQYHVIPEIMAVYFVPLFMGTTILYAVARKRRKL